MTISEVAWKIPHRPEKIDAICTRLISEAAIRAVKNHEFQRGSERTICPSKWPNRTVREGNNLHCLQFHSTSLPGSHAIPTCLSNSMVTAILTYAPAVINAVITVPIENTHFRTNESGCSLFIIRIVIKRVIVQFIEIKKFCQCHIEGKGYLVERFYSGILGEPSYNIIKSGLLYITHNGQFVNRNSPVLT